jgi:uncharacterized membrane protein (UPF0127 family)
MENKRHLVLYAVGAVAVITLLLGYLAYQADMSDTGPEPALPAVSSTTSEAIAVAASSTAVRQPFKFEVVSTQALQAKGLGGRSDIPSDYGMLFVFTEKEKHGFWMKDMLASIDILWISDQGVVVGIEAAVSPATYPAVFYPPEPVRYVLETRSGEAARLGIVRGTKLNLPLP